MVKKLVDRVEEISAIREFINQPQYQPHIKVLSAKPHSGLTYFLTCCAETNDPSQIWLYADGAKHEGNSLFAQLVVGLFHRYPLVWEKFLRSQARRAGNSYTRQLSTIAAESVIPYIGRSIGRIADLAYPTLPVSAYPSVAAEILCEFFVELSRNHKICLFLDNVQEVDDWSAQLLSATVGKAYSGIRYIAGFVTRANLSDSNVNHFVLKSRDIGYQVKVDSFPIPNDVFIQQYASSLDLTWPMNHCAAIAAATEGDIYKIRSALITTSEKEKAFAKSAGDITPIANTLRTLLAISKQNLRLSDLLTIVLGDEAIFVKDEQEIMKTVEDLLERDEIRVVTLPDGDKLVSLQPSPDRVIKELGHSVIEITRIEVKLYDYFSRAEHISKRHSASEIAPLLFRLAKKIDTTHLNLRLRDIIKLSLQMGSRTIAEEFIDCAISSDPTSENLHDYLAKLAFLVSAKKFKQVLNLTEAPSNSEWGENRSVKILKGIALNRRRKHSESEALLASLCETSDSLEELVILASYRIVGKVHANDIVGAKELFEFYRDSLSVASNYGYFLRNGAEVYEPDQGIEILNVALQYHEKSNDTFGIATTLCNRGAKLAQLGFAEKGLTDVEKAYDILEVFGVNHLGIVIGDMAHCFLYMGMCEQAESTCRKALRYMGNELPRAYTLINLAASLLLQGKSEAAIKTIEDVIKESEHARVDRVRQKAYFNGALITLLAGAPHEYVQFLCVQSLNCPDRRNPNKTIERIGAIRSMMGNKQIKPVETFFSLYSPCSMFYWYQNPLEGLPGDFLAA